MNNNVENSSGDVSSWLTSLNVQSNGVISCLFNLMCLSVLWAFMGAVLCLALVVTLPNSWVAKSENESFDTALKDLASNGLAVANNSNKTQSFAFVDIDEKTLEGLGKYTLFPKDKMAMFLKNIANSNAKLAIIDIDFTHKDHSIETNMLEVEMKAYADNPKNPPLLLVRQITSNIVGDDDIGNLSESVYDELVEKTPHIHWVSAVFLQNSEDYTVRRQKQWVATCRNEQLIVVPAVNIVTEKLLSINSEESFQEILKKITKEEKYREICTDKRKFELLNGLYNELDNKFSLGHDSKKNRILFLYSPNMSSPIIPARSDGDYGKPLVAKFSAMSLLKKNDAFLGLIANKIVVLGVSFESSNDFVLTPLSRMPGSLAIINSINSFLSYGLVRSAFLYETFIASFILIFISIISVLLIRFVSITIIEKIGIEISGSVKYVTLFSNIMYDITIVFILIKISEFFLKASSPFLLNHGVWLNITIPLGIISLIVSVGSYQGGVRDAGKIIMNKLRGNRND